eukprot:870346-Pyramimonas_sp.AAC.1
MAGIAGAICAPRALGAVSARANCDGAERFPDAASLATRCRTANVNGHCSWCSLRISSPQCVLNHARSPSA